MNAPSKSVAALAAATLLSATVPAQAAMGPCMPMMMFGAGAPACNSQPAPQERNQACAVPQENAGPARGCAGNPQMGAMMGDMAAGGMGIAMAVMGAIFGPPHQ
ncbi:hypothetical protein EZJ19_02790 [Parasulfuritortus cantonensis]|uniref:Uncharacterized protein n=1 Tax=Parasulfuritortus cantonensis TaxID=2528202 RepID=A0A4R1BL85_9PROT|nr:hypothetical protein [Parasulfuritortus cantonensis]TCJ18180.1 hypothetical protein EZJ19_02790 [Parasulfuritortus cantonensis]